jgi:redox-sensitive bicupin YhaK (pirin superfamily)
MWVLPDTNGIEPSYEQRDLGATIGSGELVPVASGRNHDGAVSIHQRDAVLWVGRLPGGARIAIPDAAHVHVFMAIGDGNLDGAGALGTGDAARLAGAGALELTAGADGAEVLVWETA